MALILGIDPGKKQTGFCLLTTEPVIGVLSLYRAPNQDLCDFLWNHYLDAVVMEDWRVYKWSAMSMIGSDMTEVRLIGAVEEICRRRDLLLMKITPAQHKAPIDDSIIRYLFDYKNNVHLRDAFRLSLYGVALGLVR